MGVVIDARGLSCPGPVLEAVAAMERVGPGETLEVLVDSAASRDNIARMARLKGWKIEIRERGSEYTILLTLAA